MAARVEGFQGWSAAKTGPVGLEHPMTRPGEQATDRHNAQPRIPCSRVACLVHELLQATLPEYRYPKPRNPECRRTWPRYKVPLRNLLLFHILLLVLDTSVTACSLFTSKQASTPVEQGRGRKLPFARHQPFGDAWHSAPATL